MSTLLSAVSRIEAPFADDVREGLGRDGQKRIPSTYLYDELGSTLFEAITLLPEYGLSRADARLLQEHASAIAARMPMGASVVELGSGSGKKTAAVLNAMGPAVRYLPIDVSRTALTACEAELRTIADVHPIEGTFLAGLEQASAERPAGRALLILFLGSTIGNFDAAGAVQFLTAVRGLLHRGDALLLGTDLVKPTPLLLAAYDDGLGVTAAFNLNLLVRMNRELGADFALHRFRHLARYCPSAKRVEMHLLSLCEQTVRIADSDLTVRLRDGETIWTESSHKYSLEDLDRISGQAGFAAEARWIDAEWPFAESLWRVA